MYVPEEIKSYVNGVHGAFVLVDDKPAFADIAIDDYLSKTIYLFRKCIEETREASRMYVYGQEKNLVFYLDNEFTMGVMFSKNTNIHLLHRMVSKVLMHLRAPVEEDGPLEEVVERALTFFDSTEVIKA